MRGVLGSVRFWAQLALTGGFFGLLAWRVDVGDALATLPEANWAWVLPGLVVFTVSKAVHTARWRLFFSRDKRPPLSGLLGIFLIHNMANAVLLLRAGDVLRIQTTAQRYDVPRSELTANVIVVETLLDGLTFVLLVAIAFSFGTIPGALQGTFWGLAGLALLGFALGVAAANWLRPGALERIYPFRWLSTDAREGMTRLLTQFLNGMRALREWQTAVPAIALSMVGWLLEATSYWFFGQAFGLDLEFPAYMLIMMTANFAVSIPITPSGFGPYEVATQEVIVAFGAERALATGYAIGIHLCFIIWITLTGLIAMWLMRLRLEEVVYVTPPKPPDPRPEAELP